MYDGYVGTTIIKYKTINYKTIKYIFYLALFLKAMSGNALIRKLSKQNHKGAKSQENADARVPFLIKLQVSVCNFIKTETLVWGVPVNFGENFSEHLFCVAPPGNCFCIETIVGLLARKTKSSYFSNYWRLLLLAKLNVLSFP